jgi:hypothetical protein
MIRQDDLAIAVAQGVIDQATADRLMVIAASANRPHTSRLADDEPMRLLGGFNDIFLSIGAAIVAGALLTPLPYSPQVFTLRALIGVAILWLLAEAFHRRSPGRLPSLVVAAGIAAVASQLGYGMLSIAFIRVNHSTYYDQSYVSWSQPTELQQSLILLSAASTAFLASILVHLRFKLPFIVLPIALSIVGMIISACYAFYPPPNTLYAPLLLGGLASFALAMRFDASDRQRLTANAARGFWLHIAAAGLFVNATVLPLLASFMRDEQAGTIRELSWMATIVVVLGLVALAVDRRALLLSSLFYTALAASILASRSLQPRHDFPVAAFIIIGIGGLLIIILGLFWRPMRALVLAPFRRSRLLDYLPPVRA